MGAFVACQTEQRRGDKYPSRRKKTEDPLSDVIDAEFELPVEDESALTGHGEFELEGIHWSVLFFFPSISDGPSKSGDDTVGSTCASA